MWRYSQDIAQSGTARELRNYGSDSGAEKVRWSVITELYQILHMTMTGPFL